jgi:hypothetical protein
MGDASKAGNLTGKHPPARIFRDAAGRFALGGARLQTPRRIEESNQRGYVGIIARVDLVQGSGVFGSDLLIEGHHFGGLFRRHDPILGQFSAAGGANE